jgi:hypothetical protein
MGENSEWPMWRHDPGRTNGDGSAVYPPLQQVWQFQAKDAIVDSLAVAGGLVCFGSKDRNVYALDAYKGTDRWVLTLNKPVSSGPVIARGQVFFCCEDSNVYAVDMDNGKERWRYPAGVRHSPTVREGRVIVCDERGTLHCLRADDGQPVWSNLFKKSGTALGRTPPPIYEKGNVWLHGDKLRLIEAETGAVVREARRLSGVTCIASSAGLCIWHRYDELVAALLDDMDTIVWEVRGRVHWVAVDDTQVYVLTDRRTVETLPLGDDGQLGWQAFIGQNLSTKLSDAAYALAGPVLYVGTKEPACHAIWTDPTIVMKRWNMRMARAPVSMSAGSGRVFITDERNQVTAFTGQDSAGYEEQFAPEDRLYKQPVLDAVVLRPRSALKGSDALGPTSSFFGGMHSESLKQKLQLEFRGFREPFTHHPGFGQLKEAEWPNCCSGCCGPAEIRRPLAGAKHDKVPYCLSCEALVRSKQKEPAVSAAVGERDALEKLHFQNERYWTLFMHINRLK